MLKAAELKKIRKTFNNKEEAFLTNSFRALGDINRHRIFQLLTRETQMSASDIAATLKISRPLASQHLKILEQAGLFKKEKIGQHKFYQLDRQNSFVRTITEMTEKFN